VIDRLNQDSYPVALACRTIGMPRNSYYYHSQKSDESWLTEAVVEVAGQFPTYGTRRITHQLRRQPYGYQVNRKRIQRLMSQNGLIQGPKRRKYTTTNSLHDFKRHPNLLIGLEITYPDQVWVSDITYIRLKDEFVYLAVIMDIFTRAIRGWELSRQLTQDLTLIPLRKALVTHAPGIHHSDQGIQYASNAYTNLLEMHNIQISMSSRGNPKENGYAERLIRTIKEEEVDLSE